MKQSRPGDGVPDGIHPDIDEESRKNCSRQYETAGYPGAAANSASTASTARERSSYRTVPTLRQPFFRSILTAASSRSRENRFVSNHLHTIFRRLVEGARSHNCSYIAVERLTHIRD